MNRLDELIMDERVMYKAYKKSCRNRSYKMSAMKFSLNVISNLEKIQNELISRKYKVTRYTEFTVFEPKERIILACLFKDKIVQHVLCDNILVPMLQQICITDNYAGQKGKGSKFGRERTVFHMNKWYCEHDNSGYVYRSDIHKYYYNINHEIAKSVMHKYFPDYTHWLIDIFIDSTEDPGIALGNQINTIVSNIYLHELDMFITKELGYEHYGRYADDFWLIDDDKERLKLNVQIIENYLHNKLKLELNPKSQIIPFKNGIKFIGFHFYVRNNGEIEIRLDNGKKRSYRRKFNRMIKLVANKELNIDKLLKSYYSWKAHASYVTDHSIFNYYEKRIKEELFNMTIENGYYISERTSEKTPTSYKDANTFYLPVNIEELDDGTYKFTEYRFNIPIDYKLPSEIVEGLAHELDEYRRALEEVGVV